MCSLRVRPSSGSIRPLATAASTSRRAAFVSASLMGSPGAVGTHRTLRPQQRLVPHPVRVVGLGAELLAPLGLVLAEVALEPADLRLALEGEDVGGHPVQEPPV